ncbi:MAG: T9SS type A sorting domain-containing protein [Bacteroidales bacterium]|nr:T9SS type A sorting domain-containing protein [Bacteroidales bacterium]
MRRFFLLGVYLSVFSGINAQFVGIPYGFAAVSAYGVTELTGGAGGEVVIINGQADAKKLQDALDDDNNPRIIYIIGQVQLPEYTNAAESPVEDMTTRMTKVKSNKTILGLGCDATIYGSGLSIYSGDGEGVNYEAESTVKNVIIQNITFTGALDDAINIQGGSHHIWVDHCSFTDGTDGLLDFKRGSDYLTVSWCHFYNHGKMSLVGHSPDVRSMDIGHLRATYDHCYWDDYEESERGSRHPRIRHGIIHSTNCYFHGQNINSAIDGIVCNEDGRLTVEGCYYQWPKWATQVAYGDDNPGEVKQRNNTIFECKADSNEIWFGEIPWDSTFDDLTGEFPNYPSPDPYDYYSLTISNPDSVPSEIAKSCGACKINIPNPGMYYILSATVVGSGSINIVPDKKSFPAGDTVTLAPIPEAGWSFTGWTGDIESSDSVITVIMDSNIVLAANFTKSSGISTINALVINNISVIPNPFSKNAHIHFELTQPGKISINLYDINGCRTNIINDQMYAAGINKAHLDKGELQPGIYFIEVISNSCRKYTKVIIH